MLYCCIEFSIKIIHKYVKFLTHADHATEVMSIIRSNEYIEHVLTIPIYS